MNPPNWTPMQLPHQQMPQAPYYPAPPPPPQKPSTFYKVVGILLLVFGIGGILWTTVSLAMTAFATSLAPGAMAIYDAPTLAFLYTHTGFGLVTGALLVAAGIGILKAKKWSRPVGIVYAGLSLANTLIGTVIQLVVVQPKIYGSMGALKGSESLQIFSVGSAVIGALVVMILPIFTLIALLRGAAKQELDQ